MDFFEQDQGTGFEAKEHVQHLAFGPIAFQAARALVNLGLLAALEKSRPHGLTPAQAARDSGQPLYGTRVLLEAGLGLGLATFRQERFHLAKAGHFLLRDPMTRVNFDFVNDICYHGMAELEKAVTTGKPKGLQGFGPWPTIYEALAHLPEPVKASWLKFDHFYSDAAFPEVLPLVFKHAPRRLLDVGGNTGRWALQCVGHSPDVRVGIADLPGQIQMAETELRPHNTDGRITFHRLNLLEPASELPAGFDAVWMSQFLDCFSEAQIKAILAKCRQAMTPESRLFILELFWDRQKFQTAAFSLQMTSLYFTAMANGNSQMYRSGLFLSLLQEAGFVVEEQFDQLGISHSLLVCRLG
jgi:ubiquinone/menaquinone biosynthesis C-methylase UbiE